MNVTVLYCTVCHWNLIAGCKEVTIYTHASNLNCDYVYVLTLFIEWAKLRSLFQKIYYSFENSNKCFSFNFLFVELLL